ncbi:Uncharacterized conserved protein XAP-5 [Ceraceosorus bombacis]|uniref:Uncharacterized conserved protein XAP-5 n=1 Tax=Ceraceosorus bombacis TaxID=401625 RepID=A0A0N7LA17_9BASI|nr:Uncharacterized conserved protein XAP-5 [Ceraceosorus bombacis]
MLSEFERQKADLAAQAEKNARGANERFVGNSESIEESLKKQTVGLVTAEDFKRKREELEEEKRKLNGKAAAGGAPEKKKKKDKKQPKATLSFADEDEEDAAPVTKKVKSEAVKVRANLKNPGVDTSFLPDRDREQREADEREALRKEWLAKQETMKKEEIEITYSYWDGSGHRRSVKCLKGDSVAQFLEKCRQQFTELRTQSVDNLMYIKEDLIIPHHYTFYDFIVNKSRGKSGPLFNFDVHEDIRMISDARVEKDESHAGKVVERSWYNRNKHIFPASRWEQFEMGKDYGSYSIADRS